MLDTAGFVKDVLKAIAYKSYLPGAGPPPRDLPPAYTPQEPPPAPIPFAPLAPPNGPANLSNGGSRKRGYHDFDAPGGRDYPVAGQRVFKQARRSNQYLVGRGGRIDDGRGRGQGWYSGQPGAQLPLPPPGMPQFDPNNPMEAIFKLQAMGVPMPSLPGAYPTPSSPQQGNRRPRCRDFDTKGYCNRPNCSYGHGSEPLFVPAAVPLPEGQ
jgi:RNA-binding protein 26